MTPLRIFDWLTRRRDFEVRGRDFEVALCPLRPTIDVASSLPQGNGDIVLNLLCFHVILCKEKILRVSCTPRVNIEYTLSEILPCCESKIPFFIQAKASLCEDSGKRLHLAFAVMEHAHVFIIVTGCHAYDLITWSTTSHIRL